MKIINKWREVTNTIVNNFVLKYFGKNVYDVGWIGEDYMVFSVSDYYFNFSDAVYCLENDVSEVKLFEWYDKTLEFHTDLSLKDFLIEPEKLEQMRRVKLKELKLRVEEAEKTFKEALDEYES